MATKIQLVLGAPAFEVGERVYGNGKLHKGFGEVIEVREAGQGKFTGDVYPQVVVKFPDYMGPRYGNRSAIRYNGEDLANGLLLHEAQAPKPVRAAVPVWDANPCGDEDPLDAAIAGLRTASDNLSKAIEAVSKAIADMD